MTKWCFADRPGRHLLRVRAHTGRPGSLLLFDGVGRDTSICLSGILSILLSGSRASGAGRKRDGRASRRKSCSHQAVGQW